MRSRIFAVLAALSLLASWAMPVNGGWCAGQPAAVAAFNGWHPCDDAPHIQGYFVNGVQVGAWNGKTHIWRTYDEATDRWGPPERAPWNKAKPCVESCPCDCCGDDCHCVDGKPCGCDSCTCIIAEVQNPKMALDVPAECREWYRNPDGSCVQCAVGLCGLDQNVPEASTLLWDTEYGPAERGGSNASRVAEYAKRRGIRCYNVTGSNTWDWMKWACLTGRGCAIGAGSVHFQTLVGYDPETKSWYVNNNNSPQKIDKYSDDQLRRLHLASGQWLVVLDYPPHPERPLYQKWWKAGEGFGAPPEVERDAILRLGDMVQHITPDISDDNGDFVEAMAPPADDSGKWFISLVTAQSCAPCAKLKRDWAGNDDLRSFAKPDDAKNSWAHFTIYDKDDESQAWRFRGVTITAYPTLIIQPPRSGAYGDSRTVVWQHTGYDGNPRKLAQSMSTAIKRYVQALPKKGTAQYRPPFKPPPKPAPVTPPDLPSPAPVVPNIPPDVPPAPPSEEFPVWALVAGVLILAGAVKGQIA